MRSMSSMMKSEMAGFILALVGPSGIGKSTIIGKLQNEISITIPISCTTRKQRINEEDGREYYFLNNEEFRKYIQKGEFLEYATVHNNLYGVLRKEILSPLSKGKNLVIDIDWQGVQSLKTLPDLPKRKVVDIFISPPSLEELENRLKERGTEELGELKKRIKEAKKEMLYRNQTKYSIVSASPKEDYQRIKEIFLSEERQRKTQ